MRVTHPLNTVNFTIVHLPRVNLAFSYETLIGYTKAEGHGWVLRENDWGPTTGKHLNWLDNDKTNRFKSAVFEEKVQEDLYRRLPTGQYV